MKTILTLIAITGILLIVVFLLGKYDLIKNPTIKNILKPLIPGESITTGCRLKEFSTCYIIKLKLYDDEYQANYKSIQANIIKKNCEISGNAYNIEDSNEKWQLSGEVYEENDSIVLKLNKEISEFEDDLMQLVFISDSRSIKQLTGYVYNYQNGHMGDVKMNICNSIKTPDISEDNDVTSNDNENDTEITRYYVQLVCSKHSNIQKEVLSKAGLTDNYECRVIFNPSANCYKYIIGSFDSFEEADNFRNQVIPFYGKPVLVKEIITNSDSVLEIIEDR